MSPKSRAINTVETTFSGRNGDRLSNACSGTSYIADISWATSTERSLDDIEFESISETPLDTHIHASQPIRKRSSYSVLSPLKNQPFRTSYGSVLLSGIFADIIQASDEEYAISQDGAGNPVAVCCDSRSEPFRKKARITCSSFVDIQPMPFLVQPGPPEGTVSDVSLPTFVSPPIYTSAIKIELFNDSARELPDVAFPALPQIPNAISYSSCAQIVSAMDEVGIHENEQDGPSYGWFVSTEDEEVEDYDYFPSNRFPYKKPDLAFKMTSAHIGANPDLEVQLALAADTIDDVLGGFF